MNIDRYTCATGGIKAPDSLKKRTAELLKDENSRFAKTASSKGILRKTVAVAAAVVIVGATTVFAEEIIKRFYGADGSEIQYSESENERSVTIENVHTDYVKVINGRVYFVLGDIQIDVTDECGDTSYYRYEIKNDDGSRNVIFVGGPVENPGWVELIFDSEGKYITNRMQIRGEDNWSDWAMYSEGVPCGDPVLDELNGFLRDDQ